MTREKQVEILINDGCTKREAEKFFERGTTVFTDFEENFEDYMSEWKSGYCDEGDYEEMVSGYRNMIETGIPATDWGIVETEGKKFYIMYVN